MNNPFFTSPDHRDTPLHLAVLRYLENPFYLRYLLTYPEAKIPHTVENARQGWPSFFLISSYTQDSLFEQLLLDFFKERPSLDLNYQCTSTGETLLEVVMFKCPSFFKFKLIEDFGFNLCQFGLTDRIIQRLNQSAYTQCSHEDKERFVNRLYRHNEGKRLVEFVKICRAFKETQHPMGKLSIGIVREIAKYIT